ncbi:unnamed protein product [Adineta ricciae]|uniref:BEN domain-containing protein n=1 Tax=Adineta ricciae TaxID=249248 RepID=A0A815TTD5_ADIRI|nr:unnamed protein product [Adineta ricciae]CAF1508293.1 unnamed protein product [Adineta ricciae]
MPKRRPNRKNLSKENDSAMVFSMESVNSEGNIVPRVSSANQSHNEKDIFDQIDPTMRKKRKHVADFNQSMKRTKVVIQSDSDTDNNGDDAMDDPTERSADEISKPISPSNAGLHDVETSSSNGARNGLSADISLATPSRDESFILNKHNGKRVELNKSILLHKQNPCNQSVTSKNSSTMVNSINDELSLHSQDFDQGTREQSQQFRNTLTSMKKPSANFVKPSEIISSQTTSIAKHLSHASKSTITFGKSMTDSRYVNSQIDQSSNHIPIDRSLICSANTNSDPLANRSSTSVNSQLRPIDVRNTFEYRELEKINKSLSGKVDNLKEALVKERKERKKILETHMLKPRSNLWHELSLFMQIHGASYHGDGRTISDIGRDLGLSEQIIVASQRDTDKPDKVAMNVWRRLCPTVDDKVFVGSIKRVPVKTLENIYAFARLSHPTCSFDYKKMKSDIAANIRQGNLAYRVQGSMAVNYDLNQQDADSDEDDESNDEADDQSRVPSNDTQDKSSTDEEE